MGRLTWIKDNRAARDETSSKILAAQPQAGTSIFDPVLCELAYRWFCPPGGLVLDPFAGGSVRGVVAGVLGRRYIGVELRAEQIDANLKQHAAICPDADVRWICGDSARVIPDMDTTADFVFGCPPYADLEVYSDDQADLSNMPYDQFVATYRAIVAACVERMKGDSFCVWVVGDVRDGRGMYRGLPWHTVQAFSDAGANLYNEAVLVTAVGSLPLRAGKQFERSRKLGKAHQNVFTFVKGDPMRATSSVGPCDFREDSGGTTVEADA